MDDGADDAGRRNRLEFSAGEGPKPKLSIALTGPEPNLHRLGFGVDRGHGRQLRLLLLLVLLVDADRVNPEAGALISGAELLQSLQQALADLEPLVVERYGSAWLRIRAPAIRESAVSCRGGASNGSDLEGALYIRNIVSRVELDNADLALIDWAVLEVENCALPNLVLALDMRRRWWFTRFCSFSGVCQTDGWLVLFQIPRVPHPALRSWLGALVIGVEGIDRYKTTIISPRCTRFPLFCSFFFSHLKCGLLVVLRGLKC